QSALAGMRSRAPDSKYALNDFARNDAGQLEITLWIMTAQRHRVLLKKCGELMIPDIFKIPTCAGIARHPRFPCGMVCSKSATLEELIHSRRLGNVGETKCLWCKFDRRQRRISQRPLIGSNAVVVRESLINRKRQGAAAGGGRKINSSGVIPATQLRQVAIEKVIAPAVARCPHHGCLLLHFTAATVNADTSKTR